MSKYANTSKDIVSTSGGSNRVTLVGTTIRGGTGIDGATSVPCKEAWMYAISKEQAGSSVKVRIGTTCSATTGIKIPAYNEAHQHTHYIRIPIDDLNKLYFIGVAGEAIDIFYRQ